MSHLRLSISPSAIRTALDFAKRYSYGKSSVLYAKELDAVPVSLNPDINSGLPVLVSSVPSIAKESAINGQGRKRVYLPATKEEDLLFPAAKRALNTVKHPARRPLFVT